MTPFPHSIESGATVAAAREEMDAQGINHLPVLHEGRLAGLLSRRDIEVVHKLERGDCLVWDVCLRDPVIVDLNERLDRVARELSERRVGVAIITREDRLSGILTPTDIARLWGAAILETAGVDAEDGDGDVA